MHCSEEKDEKPKPELSEREKKRIRVLKRCREKAKELLTGDRLLEVNIISRAIFPDFPARKSYENSTLPRNDRQL